jgi:hypothetical protein
MNQNELYQHYVADVRELLEDGADPRELIEVLAAVSVDLALHIAPSAEYAFFSVLEGLRDMTLVHAKRGEEEETDLEADDGSADTESDASEALGLEIATSHNRTIH